MAYCGLKHLNVNPDTKTILVDDADGGDIGGHTGPGNRFHRHAEPGE